MQYPIQHKHLWHKPHGLKFRTRISILQKNQTNSGFPLRSNLQGLRNWDVLAIDEWEVTSTLLAGNILSLLSLRGYFSSASCFCLPIVMPESDDGGSGCSGQVIGPNSWDFPSTNCASNKRCGLRTTEESRTSIRKLAKQKHKCKESHKANRTHYDILEK